MMPCSTITRRTATTAPARKQVAKVSDAQSRILMDNLLEDELDKIDVEDLEEATGAHLA